MQAALCEAIRETFAEAGFTAVGVEMLDMGTVMGVAAFGGGRALLAIRVRRWWRKTAGEILKEFQQSPEWGERLAAVIGEINERTNDASR